MYLNTIIPIQEKCKAANIEYTTEFNASDAEYVFTFKKNGFGTQVSVSQYTPFEQAIEFVNERLDEFLKVVERGFV